MSADPSAPATSLPPMTILPVIMSGGAGTRLWPLSTDEEPKQFHALTSDRTMIQQTALRASSAGRIEFAAPMVVCNRRHVTEVREQLAAVGVRPAMIVAEPFGRNTAAVAVIASQVSQQLQPGARVLLEPADHLIADTAGFMAAVAVGASAADRIVTFGIEPTEPHEGYGYIQAAGALGGGVFRVERFVEKPTRTVAQAYLSDGGYYWNSGIFLFDPSVMLREFELFRPDIANAAKQALASAKRSDGVIELGDEDFARVPSESIDVAIMERTRSAAMAPCDIGWADIGSWQELWRLGPFDERGNRLYGDVFAIETENSLLWSDGAPVGVVGLKDVVVISAHGAVLVAARSDVQKVRAIAAELKGRQAVVSESSSSR